MCDNWSRQILGHRQAKTAATPVGDAQTRNPAGAEQGRSQLPASARHRASRIAGAYGIRSSAMMIGVTSFKALR